ncbi:sensor histidine kinase [Amycolatopsis sp. NPDC059027]|uniref:sensor histidine kinase n=1 Tax=unclassified Amycolatopsis TaxID=2618356 RepID=UPI00367331FC
MRGTLVDRYRARLEDSLARYDVSLPWWLPTCTTVMNAVGVIVALVQRHALIPPAPIALAGLLILVRFMFWPVTGNLIPPWLGAIAVLVGVPILLTDPVTPDFAPVLLVLLATEVAAIASLTLAFTVTGLSIAELIVAQVWNGLSGYPVYIVAVLLGLSGGVTLRWYHRALNAERGKQDAAREQAILAERQRIAREVHDVVAHSLSITLLHLTGARHGLQQDRDIDEAVEALTEAERVGRAAMADIRRTVGLLASTSTGTRPLPGIDDIAGLVERTRAAGLDVRYEQDGDLSVVGASAGLGLYRIAQESLANIAKHAPTAAARVRLRVDATGTTLTIRNTLPAGTPTETASGSGIAGMSARATQLGADLRAGPSGGHWVVEVAVPSPPQQKSEQNEPATNARQEVTP